MRWRALWPLAALLLGLTLGVPDAVAAQDDDGDDMSDLGGIDPGDDDEDDDDFGDDADDDEDFDDLIGPAGPVFLNPAVGLAAVQIRTDLEAGAFVGPGETSIDLPARVAVRDLLVLETPAASERPPEVQALVDTLVYPGNGAAATAAASLSRNVAGLLREPWRLRAAALAFNDFVRASSAGFLEAPATEFLALREVLAALIRAASPPRVAGNLP